MQQKTKSTMRVKTLEEFFHQNKIEPKSHLPYISAITHPSYKTKNKNIDTYQRLEFFGDAIIQFLVSQYIYINFSKQDEGYSSSLRANVVGTKTLSEVSQRIGLPLLLKSPQGKAASDAKSSAKVQADLFEAMTAAIYIDQGMVKTKEFLTTHLFPWIEKFHQNDNKDPKTKLQEYFQSFSRDNITYESVVQQDKTFLAKALHDGQTFGIGTGKSKKEAQTNAAIDALKKLNV
ncbi:ribonuclease III [Mycoplasma sp. Ms02]|uniref:ribonuclease III n=1 Tax=Mycoplasma sp. Ms02 TaxID=353851 RepID=UPI001C88E82B|nr:ribonuclease III [Mycoplasma sp. Ms02]QZE12295.1 ribonuclease III [Mycoplasma sp. Ms02]